MPDRSSKRRGKQGPEDVNEIAFRVLSEATEEAKPEKNPAAVELGRKGGKVGGRVRAERLSAEQRVAIARDAARARWSKRPNG